MNKLLATIATLALTLGMSGFAGAQHLRHFPSRNRYVPPAPVHNVCPPQRGQYPLIRNVFRGVSRNIIRNSGNGVNNTIFANNGGSFGSGFGRGVNVNVITNSGNGAGNRIGTRNGPGWLNINVITNSGNGINNRIFTQNR